MSIWEVDCEICRHYEDMDYCIECEHYTDHVDNYEQLSEEEIKTRDDARKQRLLDLIPKQILAINCTEEFINKFKIAKEYTVNVENDRPAFASVWCSTDRMVATDTHRIIEIKCDMPPELQNKRILQIDGPEVMVSLYVHSGCPLESGSYKEIMAGSRSLRTNKGELLAELIKPRNEDSCFWNLAEMKIVFNKSYSDKALELFTENQQLEVIFSGTLSIVLLKSKEICVGMLPIRTL